MSCSLLCQVFYLSFSKAMTLNCYSFVYYSWKSLFLQNILKCAEGQTSSFKINTDLYGIKSLSQHFEMEIYQYINITWLLLTGKYLCWSLILILSIAKFLWKYFKSTYFKEHLRMATVLLKCVHETEKNQKLFIKGFNFSLKTSFFLSLLSETSSRSVFYD